MLTSALAAASSSPMETVLHDIRYALRTFARMRGGAQTPEQVDGETVSPDYFDTLRVSPIAGRVFAGEDDAVVLISERLWRRRFNADPSIVGRNIRLNDDPLTVAGVLPASFTGLNGKSDVWIPRALAPRLIYWDYLTTPQHFISVVAP